MESLFGMEKADSGEVLIDGMPVNIDSPSTAIEKGMALLTEDRKKSGLFLVLSVLENMSIVKMPEYIGKTGFVQHLKMAEDCMEQIRRLNIKTPTMDQIINNLSGGNQQKVLIARWLLAQPKILILDEPTRGIDVGAKAEIYHLISELANRGVAVIMVSSELPEILGMSDRVMVMHEGRITGILDKEDADQKPFCRWHPTEAQRMSNMKITATPVTEKPSFFGQLRHRLPKDTGIFIVMLVIALTFEIAGWYVRDQSFY